MVPVMATGTLGREQMVTSHCVHLFETTNASLDTQNGCGTFLQTVRCAVGEKLRKRWARAKEVRRK